MEPNKKKCFVIIGYGTKISYANGRQRQLDLNQTYDILIKPVFDELGIECYRAIDKNLSGSIDKLMLEEIEAADIVIADLSTLNANVMWELGVRHALKPHHTIMICEKEQMIAVPFDVNSFVIHQYTHSEEGIPYLEVKRFPDLLKRIVTDILEKDPPTVDSPVHTFLKLHSRIGNTPENLMQNNVNHYFSDIRMSEKRADEADSATDEAEEDGGFYMDDAASFDDIEPSAGEPETPETFATIVAKAEAAKESSDFEKALSLFTQAAEFAAGNMTLRDNLPMLICRQALCTYKSKKDADSYQRALEILAQLQPENSRNPEVLGLCGAIHKRLFDLNADEKHLDASIYFYERGFLLRQDYYNGINAVFMLYCKAGRFKEAGNEDWDDVKLKADYIRNAVLDVALRLETEIAELKTSIKEEDWHNTKIKDEVWGLLTIAEAFHYKGNAARAAEYEQKAEELAQRTGQQFALDSYREQRSKAAALMEHFKN